MMKSKLLIGFALLFFTVQGIKAQDVETYTLIGKVKDANSNPVVGAYVFLDTIQTNAVTNARGFFQVTVPKEVKTVNILSEEYGILKADYSGQKTLNFMYLVNNKASELEEELIDMGYGNVLNKDKTSSVSQVEYSEEDHNFGFANIYDMINGRLSGVKVVGNKIIIRGVKTLTGSTDPLFVVDGIIRNNIAHIPPYQVKSISVLKGTSASIYGSRGANGVILISLK